MPILSARRGVPIGQTDSASFNFTAANASSFALPTGEATATITDVIAPPPTPILPPIIQVPPQPPPGPLCPPCPPQQQCPPPPACNCPPAPACNCPAPAACNCPACPSIPGGVVTPPPISPASSWPEPIVYSPIGPPRSVPAPPPASSSGGGPILWGVLLFFGLTMLRK